ncbi:MAG: Ku protein, partial [Dehalococcoidia bacterium]|nr:Ku protein [Dehalococcoidia bacterium]
ITGQNVSVLAFVDAGRIDPRHMDKSYFLDPDDKLGGSKAFSLLLQAMDKVGKFGIVKLIYREREHLAAIRPFGKVILLQTMFYTDELRPTNEVETALPQVSDKELAMGVMLLQTLEVGDIDLSQYKDGYQEALKALIQAKLEGKTIEVKAEEPKPATDDLVAALMASLKDKQTAGAGA